VIECVPNFSEGRDTTVIDAIEGAIVSVPETILLDRTSDADHNRSVITFAGTEKAVLEAAVRAAAASAKLIDLNTHRGVHPRLGAMDVLPFVPLSDATLDDCIALAHRAGERIWSELGIPVYFYQAAALRPDRVKLEDIRRGQFEAIREYVRTEPAKRPDVGGPLLHATAGAVIIGARKILIAYNITLRSNNLELAQLIARRIRSSSGGLPEVKALGLPLLSRGLVQVSMNLTDFEVTPPHVVYAEVSRISAEHGVEIEGSEVIGLIPAKVAELAAAANLRMTPFDPQLMIETRVRTRGLAR
jgi:glutamate formiminotransferase/glutamate formiminotransferase/formiminotetrahydrofolate cyclodeaminase